tara:strand:+ start:9521 stop:11743 length:2223 start_codon:yes stop_codon:yes gene_type:complete
MAGATSVGAVLFAGCAIPTRELLVQSPSQMPEDMVDGFDNWYASLWRDGQTTEGILVRVMEGRAKKIEGNPDFPTNQGKSSVRAQAALQSLYHPDRIKGPMRKQGDGFVSVSWNEAITEVSKNLATVKDNNSKALLITNPIRGSLGKLVNKFGSTFGNNIEHKVYETLEETVTRAAVANVFGQDLLPTFDIANAKTILNFGADFLGTWLSPVAFGRAYGEFRQGGHDRGYLTHVEPRMSMTAANADTWLANRPGTEGHLALSMAYVILEKGLAKDADAVQRLTGRRGSAALSAFAPDKVAGTTGIDADKIEAAAVRFATETPSIAIGGGVAAAQTNGLFNLNAIYALNYLAGSVGEKGGVVFNPSFPERDKSGVEMPSSSAAVSYEEWKTTTNGLKTGEYGMVLVHGADPSYGLSGTADFSGALGNVGTVVSFSNFLDETTKQADWILPEHHMLEDWGDDIPEPGPGYASLGVQQPVVKPVFDTRSFGDVLISISKQLNLNMPWSTVEEMVKDQVKRNFDRGSTGMIRASNAEDFWRGVLMRGGWWDVRATSTDGGHIKSSLPTQGVTPEFTQGDYHLIPFPHVALTDGSGANLVWLQATPDPLTTVAWKTWVEINPRTAESLSVREGDIVQLNAGSRSIEVPVYVHPAAAPDVLSVPIGQGHTDYGQWAAGRGENVLSLVGDKSDSETGALAWGSTKVNITKTGKRIVMPKMEGSVPAIETVDTDVIQVTNGTHETHSH